MDFSWEVVFSSAVIGAFVTSIANIIVSLVANNRLKKIEKYKQRNELITYRYTKLYEMLLKWVEFDTKLETENKSFSQIACEKIVNSFIDDLRKHNIISPLLDEKYLPKLLELRTIGNERLDQVIEIENLLDDCKSEELLQQHRKLFDEFKSSAVEFSSNLEMVLREQLKELLELQQG